MLCPYPMIYVGKTIQQLRRKISKHLSSINTNADTPISRHIRQYHDGNAKTLKFWGICQIKLGPRKGDLNKKLLQEEARWIYRLDCPNPKGLNDGFTFLDFL